MSRPPLTVGAEVSYVSLDGISVCRAIVRNMTLRGVDLEVYSPGCADPVLLTRIPHHDGESTHCPRGHCFTTGLQSKR